MEDEMGGTCSTHGKENKRFSAELDEIFSELSLLLISS